MNATTRRQVKAHADANNTVKKAAAAAKAKAPAPKKAPKASTVKAKAPKAKEFNACFCGCGESTLRLYCPGHDARHAGQVARSIIAGGDPKELKVLATPALRAKAERMVHRAEVAAKAKALKAQAKADYDAALAALTA